MAERILIRRDTTSNWTAINPVLGPGEPGVDLNTGGLRIGDGTKAWGDLPETIRVDPNSQLFADSIMLALRGVNDARYVRQADVYVWSQPNLPAGSGPGGVSIDATAAANVPRNVSNKVSEGYVAIGRGALGTATRARSCIAIGSAAMGFGNPGFGNLALGVMALARVQGVSELAADMAGSRNIGIGSLAGAFLTSGFRNAFLGRDSGQTVTTGARNTGLGYRAGSSGIAPVGLSGAIENQYPTTGNDNTSVGDTAAALITGSSNSVFGAYALAQAAASDQNVVMGYQAAYLMGRDLSENNRVLTRPALSATYSQTGSTITVTATGHGVTAGSKVQIRFTSGALNTVTAESQYLTVASVPDANTFTIVSTASVTASGNATIDTIESTATAATTGGNTTVGYQANSDALTSGGNNTFVGIEAGKNARGNTNTFVGGRAGFNQVDGDSCTYLGYNAGRANINGGGLTGFSNVTVLGAGAGATGANQVQLGGTGSTPYAYAALQVRSDARDKRDVRDTIHGLDTVLRLRPVDFRRDPREAYHHYDENDELVLDEQDGSKAGQRFHHGFIAQEIAEVIEATGKDFGGYQDHSVAGGDDVRSVGYEEFIPMLVKSVQELSEQLVDARREIEQLKNTQ